MRLIDGDALLHYLRSTLSDLTEEDGAYEWAWVDAIHEIEHAPTVNGWISVKDRLPDDEGDVFVYGVSPRGRKKVAVMNYLAFEADRPRWALDGIWTVLYWMPIPEPPKEVSGDAGQGNSKDAVFRAGGSADDHGGSEAELLQEREQPKPEGGL